jgi:hypothetical protein
MPGHIPQLSIFSMNLSEPNSESSSLTEFLKRIGDQHEAGYGFVPFVGAGLPVASGIPAIPQLTEYLRFSILSLLYPDIAEFQFVPTLTNHWPPQDQLLRPQRQDTERTFHSALRAHLNGKDISKKLRGSATESTLQDAFGAMSDWRASLRFLSRRA